MFIEKCEVFFIKYYFIYESIKILRVRTNIKKLKITTHHLHVYFLKHTTHLFFIINITHTYSLLTYSIISYFFLILSIHDSILNVVLSPPIINIRARGFFFSFDSSSLALPISSSSQPESFNVRILPDSN